MLHTGLSLHRYLLRYRIDRALEYLQGTDMTAAEIAGKVGFGDVNHFLKVFRRETGRTTREYRAR